MAKTAVVYWSGTGNTETLANEIVNILEQQGGETSQFVASDFTSNEVPDFDTFFFGCSAQGAEELEEGDFLPMWEQVKPLLSGKKVALFGSYGWGSGEYMDNWKEDCANSSIAVCDEFVCEGEPDEDALATLKEFVVKI